MAKIIYGSINLSKANKAGMIKKVTRRDGTTALFLQIAVIEKKEPKTFTDKVTGMTRTYTHFVSCAPKPQDKVEGVDYLIGDMQTREPQPVDAPTEEEVAAAEPVMLDESSELLF